MAPPMAAAIGQEIRKSIVEKSRRDAESSNEVVMMEEKRPVERSNEKTVEKTSPPHDEKPAEGED